jgi:hypothetical protein
MRSTWVRTIRLQQYRLSCSSSRASLERTKRVNEENKKKAGMNRCVVTDIPFGHVFCEEIEIGVPFVANDFSAREATNRDNLRNGGESVA